MENYYQFYLGPHQKEPLLALATLMTGFLIYLSIYVSPAIKKRLESRFGKTRGLTHWVVLIKLTGFLLLGLVPALLILAVLKRPLSDFGAGPMTPAAWKWMGGLIVFVLVLNALQGRRPANYNVYPLIREKEWSAGLISLSMITSTLFIIGYEFLFRGFLLFACLPLMGIEVAVLLNVLVYSFAHIHKGMQETLASVPFGIILCYVTLTTGSFWAIMVAHIILSLSADFFGLISNPDMTITGFAKKKRA